MLYFVIISILIIIIVGILVYFQIKQTKSKFDDTPSNTKYNIINYINEIQANENTMLKGKKSIADIMLHNIPASGITVANLPPELEKYGFKSCESAVDYFKKNNLSMFVETAELPTPLASICASYLQGTDTKNLTDMTTLNSTLTDILTQVNKGLDLKFNAADTNTLLKYMESRYPQLATNPEFSQNKSIGHILNFYNNKMNQQLPSDLQIYTDMIHGRFQIIPNQFIQLNEWDMEILSNTIYFIYSNTRVVSYKFKYSDINPGAEYIYIQLRRASILDNTVLTEKDTNDFIKFLNDLNFRPGIFIHIAKITNNTYAIKSSDFNTMFLIEEVVASSPKLVLQGVMN
jgi:hypothetical protein